jgi:hypothetical protein
MRYSSRLFLYAPFVILLLIAAVAMLRWRQVATEWETKLLAANRGAEIAPGVTLHFASEDISGFPFNLDVVFDNLALSVRSTRGPISLASEHFAIHALTYGRAQQIFEAAGRQILTWTDAGGEGHRFAFVPGTMRASAIENDGRLARFDLDLNTLASPVLTGARAQLHIRAARDLLDFVILADDLRVASAADALPHFELRGRMTQATPLAALLSGRDEWRRALTRWSVANGMFQLDSVNVTGRDSQLTGEGALRFDGAHRLSGTLRMHVSDAGQWRPTRLVAAPFTSALQELVDAAPKAPSSSLPLSLDVHNGAAIVSAPGKSRSAGTIGPLF